jgi:hypothetical protein
MKKKIEFNKEYLEKKFAELVSQREKIAGILDKYSDLYTKVEGAMEVTKMMLDEINPPEEEPDEKEKTDG